jgi:hypothetical protein
VRVSHCRGQLVGLKTPNSSPCDPPNEEETYSVRVHKPSTWALLGTRDTLDSFPQARQAAVKLMTAVGAAPTLLRSAELRLMFGRS